MGNTYSQDTEEPEQAQPPAPLSASPSSLVLQDPVGIQVLQQEFRGNEGLTLQVCDIAKRFQTFKTREHTTASASRVAFASLLSALCTDESCPQYPVAVKLFFGKRQPSLVYEAEVYRDAITPMIESRQCPCFVEFVAYAKCEGWRQSEAITKDPGIAQLVDGITGSTAFKSSLGRHRREIRTRLARERIIAERMGQLHMLKKTEDRPSRDDTISDLLGPLHMLVTQRAASITGGTALDKGLFRGPKKIPAVRLLMLQMTYAMSACLRNGLFHYDLHTDNFLLQAGGYPKPTIFAVDRDHLFLIPKGAMKLLIFDWDVAYSTKVGDNPKLQPGMDPDFCGRFNVCNRPNAEAAVYKTFCALYYKQDLQVLQDAFRLIFQGVPKGGRLSSFIIKDSETCYTKSDASKTVGTRLDSVLRDSTDFDPLRLTIQQQVPDDYDLYVLDPGQRADIIAKLKGA